MLAGVLEKTANRGPIVMQLSHLLGKFPDKAAVLEATRAVTAPYDTLPEAHYAVGVAALIAGNVELAMREEPGPPRAKDPDAPHLCPSPERRGWPVEPGSDPPGAVRMIEHGVRSPCSSTKVEPYVVAVPRIY